jgi:hypothetical protein
VLPRAALVEPGPLAGLRHALRGLAWWRTRSPGGFVVGHCATAGLLQLGALLVDLARAGRPAPDLAALGWAWLGLALVATIPALISAVLHAVAPPARRAAGVRRALAVGAAFYLVLPGIALGGALVTIATLIPVAVLWHGVLALAPFRPLEVRRAPVDAA